MTFTEGQRTEASNTLFIEVLRDRLKCHRRKSLTIFQFSVNFSSFTMQMFRVYIYTFPFCYQNPQEISGLVPCKTSMV